MSKWIDIEGLPEGWEVVAIRVPKIDEYCLGTYEQIYKAIASEYVAIIVQKSKPRRIVLEETGEDANCKIPQPMTNGEEFGVMVYAHKIWRIKEE